MTVRRVWVGAALAVAAVSPVWAQSVPYLQDSSVSAFGSVISITRLPIQKTDGTFVYKDVTVTLSTVDGNGTLKNTAKVVQALSPPINPANIVAGIYARADEPGDEIQVSGPFGIVGSSDAKWTIVHVSGFNLPGVPAEFYTGSIEANPLYARLQAANISDEAYSYGVVDSGAYAYYAWEVGGLIGAQQLGSQLEIDSFSYDYKDQNTPAARYIYNRVQ